MCGAKHIGSGAACVKKCIEGGMKPVFVDAEKQVWAIDNPDAVKDFLRRACDRDGDRGCVQEERAHRLDCRGEVRPLGRAGISIGTRHAAQSLLVSYRFPLPAGSAVAGRAGVERLKATGKPMARAIWNGRVIAESDRIVEVDGNVYFPESSLKREYFRPSTTTSTDPAKGQERYMSIVIDGQDNQDAAWYYPDPKPIGAQDQGIRAFWRGVEVEK